MLYYDILDFIASCCRLFIDLIISYCLRTDIELFQEIHKFSLLDKCKVSMIRSIGPNECPLSYRRFANAKFEFQYLKD